MGPMDVLINNAAYQMAQTSLEDFSLEQNRTHLSHEYPGDVRAVPGGSAANETGQ